MLLLPARNQIATPDAPCLFGVKMQAMHANPHTRPPASRALTPWLQEARVTMTLAVPLILTVIAHMAMMTTDRIMMGWLGSEVLAAGLLGGHLFATLEHAAIGVLGAVAPVLSQHLGARRFRQVRPAFRHSMWMAAITSLPCMILIWHAGAILVLLGQDPELASAGQTYVRAMVWGFLPILWFVVLSRLLAAHMRPRATLIVVVCGIGTNALADYALMFGQFGLPRLGLVGAGMTTAIVSVLMFAVLLAFVLHDRRLRRYRLLGRFWRVDRAQLQELARLGLPIAVTNISEVGIFLASTLLMGLIGAAALAAHAIALQCSALVYMVPYGIAQAATVRVGREAGAGNRDATARAGWTALLLGVGFSILPAAAFWFFGGAIVDIFLDLTRPENRTAIDLAVSFLAIAAAFQMAEAGQATALGALRGLKDTRGPMLIALAGFWGVGFISSAVFGIYLGFGGHAIWISLAAALTVVGVLLVWRFFTRSPLLINRALHSS